VATPPRDRRAPFVRTRAAVIPWLTVEQALYAGIVALAFAIRIWDVGARAMHGDEAVHAWFAWNLFNGAGYQYDPTYHGPLQFPITAVFFFLFGVSNASGRLMAVLFGTALVGLPYFLRRELGRPAALIAAGLIAISPAFVYVSRLERDDIFTSFFAFTMAIAIFGYLRTHRKLYVYLGASAAALSLSAMENTYITYFLFGSFLLVALLSELLSASQLGERIYALWTRTGSASWICGPVLAGMGVLVLLAFLLTVATGWYLPVPLVLGFFLVGLVHRLTFLIAREDAGKDYPTHQNVVDGVPVEPAHSWAEEGIVEGADQAAVRPGRITAAIRSISPETWLNALTIVVAILFLLFSTFGTNLRGIWDYTQPILSSGASCGLGGDAPFHLNPCRKDVLGGLFYWLAQHKVARGGQPWFYYTLVFGLYEQIAMLFGVGGILWFLRKPTLFTTFLTYWAILSFGIYSWAGEKFPWLTIHPLLPFVLIGSMFVADLARRPGVVRYSVLTIAALLAAAEVHNMYESSFVNGANPVDMLVYVQSSPDTPRIAQDILTISNQATNGNTLHATIDNEDTWPFAWYLRDMPNIGYPSYPQLLQAPYSTNPVIIVDADHQSDLAPKLKGYVGHPYTLRWWFPEDYKSLSWSSFFQEAAQPGYWNVIWQWQTTRRPFGPKGYVQSWYYVKKGFVSPY
jgi:uncharacterized protein (TIGR03663 family)